MTLTFINKITHLIGGHRVLVNYVSSSMISVPVSLVTSALTLRSIDPGLMGIWSAVTVFQGYASFLGIGLVNGLARELPLLLGKGDKDKAENYAATTLHYSVVQSIIFFFSTLVFIFYNFDKNYYYTISIAAIGLKLCMGVYQQYLEATFRSNTDFEKLSKIQWLSTVFRLVFSPIVLLGFEFYILYMILFDISRLVLSHIWRPMKIKARFSLEPCIRLLKTGLPLFFATYFGGLIDTVPRLLILFYGNEYYLGLFAPVLMIGGIFEQLTGAFSNFITPKIMYKFGFGVNLSLIQKSNTKLIFVLTSGLIVLLLPFFLLLHFFSDLFPKYSESVNYVYIYLASLPLVTYKLFGPIWVLVKNFTQIYLFQLYKFIAILAGTILIFYTSGLNILYAVVINLIFVNLFLWIAGYLRTSYDVKMFLAQASASSKRPTR